MAKMTPKEFHTYWYTDEQALLVAGEYLNTKSQAERMEVLLKWGLTEYKKEVERNIWLDELLWTYIENPPSPRVLSACRDGLSSRRTRLEQEQLIKRFKEYLQDLGLLREYEIEDLIETYRGELTCQLLFSL